MSAKSKFQTLFACLISFWLLQNAAGQRPTWLKQDYRQSADNAAKQSTSVTVDPNLTWHDWDFELQPGAYRLIKHGSNATFYDYAAVGLVDALGQIDPIRPDNRLAELGNRPLYEANDYGAFERALVEARARPPLVPQTFYMVLQYLLPRYVRKLVDDSVDFRVNSGVFRIEFFAQADQHNPNPLPTGWTAWPSYEIELSEWPVTFKRMDRGATYGNTRFAIARRTFTDQSVTFNVEDGHDQNFMDLIVELIRTGD